MVALTFQKLPRLSSLPAQACNSAFLQGDNWDDFGHKTLFSLVIFDEQGIKQIIGNLKIAFVGQNGGRTEEQIPQQFDALPGNFYSLGQDADYYRNIVEKLNNKTAIIVLKALGDIAHDQSRLIMAENEDAFDTSLLRTVNRSSIEHQYRRILRHEAPLTSYKFFYEKEQNKRYAGVKIEFSIEPNSKPSSNIHILIGRNGVGKTTLLNNMVDALLPGRGEIPDTGHFAALSPWTGTAALDNDYFAGVVSVSFSAFDPFTPPNDQTNASVGMRYSYVGLKKHLVQDGKDQWKLKDKIDLCRDFTRSLHLCFSIAAKRDRWINAVRKLESDFNFAEMDLCNLANVYTTDLLSDREQFNDYAKSQFGRMSSGHAIVLLTVTKLVETVEEKTLVLLDEPETHLHPPLLSAFTRTLSDLLINRNGVAIIATHSPVVLQEVPKSCVSILRRTGLIANVDRPQSETFAENVGILTREVFGLEVSKSGFHDLLENSVSECKSYEEIVQEYQYQLGFEGKAILRSMIAIRNSQEGV